MADRRRRRIVQTGEDSEISSEGSDGEHGHDKESEQESELEKPHQGSEGESVGEVSEEDRQKVNLENFENFTELDSTAELVDEQGGVEEAADPEGEYEDFVEEDEEDDEEEDYVEGERQQGDGEESVAPVPAKDKALDFDEDRRNPQYIPKKGSFYEHDDRMCGEEEEEEKIEIKDPKKKKKLWLDEGRWGHDMFREEDQAPKSRDELITIYGYDIRSEDGPPRARRRRRYGRGPNKYTRSWQDEDAYARMPGGGRGIIIRGRGRGRGYRGREDFSNKPRVISENLDSLPDNRTSSLSENNEVCQGEFEDVERITKEETVIKKEDFPALPGPDVPVEPLEPVITTTKNVSVTDDSDSKQQVGELKTNSPEVVRTLMFENSHYHKGNRNEMPSEFPRGRGAPSRFRQRGNSRPPMRRGMFPRAGRGMRGLKWFQPPRTGDPVLDSKLTAEMEKMALNDSKPNLGPEVRRENSKSSSIAPVHPSSMSQPQSSEVVQTSAGPPPRMADSVNRPKRYSSLRQRALPETSTYPASQASMPPQFFDASYQAALFPGGEPITTTTQPPAGSPTLLAPAHFQGYTASPYQEGFAPMRPPAIPSPPRIFTPATLAAGQPVMPSPAYITPNAASIVNYAPPPPPAAFTQYSFQQYVPPAPPPPPVSQPQEIYRCGITYYNTQSQQQSHRALPQKRPKAAIPIVPPPDTKNKIEARISSGQKEQTEEFVSEEETAGPPPASSEPKEGSEPPQVPVEVEG